MDDRERCVITAWWKTQEAIVIRKKKVADLQLEIRGFEEEADEYVEAADEVCNPVGSLVNVDGDIFVAAIENDDGHFNFHVLKSEGSPL